jgi:hypothetical protein
MFITTIYSGFFYFAARISMDAPTNDLATLQLNEDYRQIDSKITGVAARKL